MKYVFTEEEFVTLLAIGGIKRLYSFELNSEYGDSQIVSSVHSLYKSRFISEEDGKMVVIPELEKAIRKMADDTHVIRISVPVATVPSKLVYLSDVCEVIVLERLLSSRENCIKLEKTGIDDLIYDIINNELDELISFGKNRDEELIEKMREIEPDANGAVQTVLKLERILVSAGKIEQTVNVNTTAVFPRIVTVSETGVKDELYSEDRMQQILFKTIGRE